MRRKTTPKTRRTSLPLWSPYDLDLETWEVLLEGLHILQDED